MKGKQQYRPSLDMVERLQCEVIYAKQDAQAALHWQGFYYVRYQQQLYRLTAEIYLAEQQQVQTSPETYKICFKRLRAGFVREIYHRACTARFISCIIAASFAFTAEAGWRKNSFIWPCRYLAAEKSNSGSANISLGSAYYSNIKHR